MIPRELLVLGVKVGSVRRKGGFAWSSADAVLRGQDDPSALGDAVVTALNSGRAVAIAFECPLSVPVPGTLDNEWKDLGRARAGEGNRSWSAVAGTEALATGLVQLSWLLGYIRQHLDAAPRVTTQPTRFIDGVELLIAEAMEANPNRSAGIKITPMQSRLRGDLPSSSPRTTGRGCRWSR